MKAEKIEISKTDAGIPVVSIGPGRFGRCGYTVAVRTGSRDESPDIFGISHLLEHSVFRAAGGMNSFQMSMEMESAGGYMNAFTSKELTGYHATTINETAHVARDMVAKIVSQPNLDGPDIELEKKIVLQEISMWENDPESYVHKLLSDVLWDGHSLSQNEAGLSEVVESLGEKELREYYEERYGAAGFLVVSCGDSSHKETVEWVSESFDGMSCQPVKRTPPGKTSATYEVFSRDGDHCYVGMGFRTAAPEHEDSTALALLTTVLGVGASSRLFNKVREESALVYAVYATMPTFSDAGCMETYFSSTPENVLKAIEAVASVWKDVRDSGLSEGELQKAKNVAWGRKTASSESTDNTMYAAVKQYMNTGRVESMSEFRDRIFSVTEEDIGRVIDRYLKPEGLRMVLHGNSPEMKGFNVSQLDF